MNRILLAIILAATCTACQKRVADHQNDAGPGSSESAAEAGNAADAVQFKEGRGIAFHPKLRERIQLQIADVSEEKVAPAITAKLHVIQGADSLRQVSLTSGGTEANGWLPAAQARLLEPGQEVDLRVDGLAGGTSETGVVKRVEKSPHAAFGEYEVAVETGGSFDTGTRLAATFHAPAGEPVTAVPRSALFKTAEGWFVYTVNESFFLRTAVQVGAMNENFAEITDGLYSGDEVVVSPVNTLWMAELQLIRGGKACTCAH